MDSRKYQLQKQITDALNANDDNLYSLLKSQWAHRFGVESLVELENLEFNQSNQKSNNLNKKKVNQSQENTLEGNEEVHIKDDDNQEKEIKPKASKLKKEGSDVSTKTKSYEELIKENVSVIPVKENKAQIKIKALIPLPPKPKYSYLQKWLLRK